MFRFNVLLYCDRCKAPLALRDFDYQCSRSDLEAMRRAASDKGAERFRESNTSANLDWCKGCAEKQRSEKAAKTKGGKP